MKSHLIVFANEQVDIDFSQAVAKLCAVETVVFDDMKTALQKANELQEFSGLMLFITSAAQMREFEKLTASLNQTKLTQNKVHAICLGEDFDLLQAVFHNSLVGHIGIKNSEGVFFSMSDAKNYARVIRMTNFDTPFGLKTLLAPGTVLQAVNFSESSQKPAAAAAVASCLQEHGCSRAIADTIANAADELLMNAMYDAQVDSKGEQIISYQDRTKNLIVSGVKMNVGMDEEFVAINVVDSSGSLNRSRVLHHISKFTKPSNDNFVHSATAPEGGGGIGLSLIMRSGGSICIVSEPGKRTEATAFFKATKSAKELKTQFQFVSTFVTPA